MLTTRLKDYNWALHQIAERQETPGSLIKGTMPKSGYIDMLAQQLLINRALDEALHDAVKNDPRVSELVLSDQMLTPYIVDDLAFFGVQTDAIEPTPGTARYIEHINDNRDNPLHLLGLHYVRLGACNGNRFVARVVRKSFGLGETEGTRYLDPFGDAQRSNWVEFKAALDAMPFDETERDTVFGGTRAAYLYAINLDEPQHLTAEQLMEQHGKTLDKEAFDEGHSVHVKTPSEQHQHG